MLIFLMDSYDLWLGLLHSWQWLQLLSGVGSRMLEYFKGCLWRLTEKMPYAKGRVRGGRDKTQ